ncbi:MAG: hypothetical protein ABI383_04705 [Acidobacteriaceae bacterium]
MRSTTRHLVALALCLGQVCAAKPPSGVRLAKREYAQAEQLLRKGEIESALKHAQTAKDAAPADVKYVAYVELLRQVRSARKLADGQRLAKAGDYKSAVTLLQSALQDDPNNPELAAAARDAGLHTVNKQALSNVLVDPEPMEPEGATLVPRDPAAKRDFHLRGTAGQVLTDFFRQYGIALQVDSSVLQRQIKMDMTGGDYTAALAVLLKQAHVFVVPASATQGVAYNDTPEQRSNHENLYLQTFDIKEAGSAQNINEITNALRAIFNFKSVGQTAEGKLALKGTRAQIEEAAKFIEMAVSARPELMLDINEIEISDSLVRQAGLTVPLQFQALNISTQLQNAGVSSLSDLQSQLAAGTLSQAALASLGSLLTQLQMPNQGVVTFGGGRTQELVLVPAVLTATFNDQKNHARILEHISLRAVAGSVATYHDGFRYPIVTTTFSTLINQNLLNQLTGTQLTVPPPAVEYVDLGISLKVTPRLQSNRDVALDFELQIKTLTGATVNLVPVIGSREFTGAITLREGESALLAGLTEQTELNNNSGIPGLSSIGLAALGGSINRNKQQNEILITVTPHAVRLPQHQAVAFPME